MQNAIFDNIVAELKSIFGTPRHLVSKNGVRFQRNGSVTVYHEELAPGNNAEIALNVQAVATTFGVTPQSLIDLANECNTLTGRAVEINKRQNWPRIGIVTEEHVLLVKEKLSALLVRKAQ